MTMLMIIAASIVVFAFVVLYPQQASAHCDTMDGPTAKDGKLALESKNLNYALKWIEADGAGELRKIFDHIKVRALGPDARDLADQYFLESLVRIHRAGEGAPFEGLKPSVTPPSTRRSPPPTRALKLAILRRWLNLWPWNRSRTGEKVRQGSETQRL